MSIAFGDQPANDIYIELFDFAAPITVSNFLNYVENTSGEKRYDGSFIHRSIPGFVIQGGGFSYDPGLGDFGTTSAPHIITDPPITNEFDSSRSNVRGTIAMAKIDGDANSATSEWFFNLVDNAADLDSQNGGFTVFGQVLSNGMDLIDSIAGLATENLGGTFQDLPVFNYTSGSPVTAANLVTVNTTSSPYPPPFFITPAPLDFGLRVINTGPVEQTVTIQNISNKNLSFGLISGLDVLVPPYSIAADSCSSQIITPSSFCTLQISYTPTTPGLSEDTINIPSDDPTNPSIVFSVSGSGAPTTASLETNPVSLIDFGSVDIAGTADQQITIRNVGGGILQPGAIEFSGANASLFTIDASTSNCEGAQLAFTESCSFTVRLTPDTVGPKSATLLINASPNGQLNQLGLIGDVILPQPDLLISESIIDVGDTQAGTPKTATVTLANAGTLDLIFTDISISGTDAENFTSTNNCNLLAPDEFCQELITFTSSTTGTSSATLQVSTNDPDTPVSTVPIIATSSTDSDGVPDDIEAAGPNRGDGNQDGTPDSQQANVTTLLDLNGNYVTVAADPGTQFLGVSIDPNPAPETTPTAGGTTITFPNGFVSFLLDGIPVGSNTAISIFLPTNNPSVNSYFKYGWIPGDNPLIVSKHWYQFDFDGRTGAEIQENQIILHFVDGGFGDADLTPNGRIFDPGGPASINLGSSSSSSGGGCSLTTPRNKASRPIDMVVLLVLAVVLRLLRKRYATFENTHHKLP
ncbi:choice-of-anchor D domain-containing protein [Thiogranum longum]|nr:choice-of-anchor D domain-containing protein [Thiogranum longum]